MGDLERMRLLGMGEEPFFWAKGGRRRTSVYITEAREREREKRKRKKIKEKGSLVSLGFGFLSAKFGNLHCFCLILHFFFLPFM